MPMAKKPLPFGEWRPDIALRDNDFAAIAENVYPSFNSYEPFPGLANITTTALAGTICGLTFARTASGAYVIYGGTSTKLWKWTLAGGWADVSRLAGGNYNMAAGDRWSFRQFGTKLYATNINDVLQSIDVDVGTNFAAVAGSPPQASSVAVIGDFLVLSGLSTNRRKIQWSAINDPTGWTVGTNLSDEQEFPDGGPVQGVAGGEIGFVVQDRSIRTMQFLPGDSTTIFSFSRVEREKGCVGKDAFVFTRGVLFFLAEDGFYALGFPNPAIGTNTVNHWFMANSDPARRDRVLAFADANHTRVLWAFHNNSGSTAYDRLIIFDWNLNRWSYATPAAVIWGTSASAQIDLDTSIVGNAADVLLDSAEPSLDSYLYIGGRPQIAGIDINGMLGFLDGPNLAAIVETAEGHLSPGMRTFVSAVYPLIDASSVTMTIGERERLQDVQTWGIPQSVGSTGSAAVYSSSRLHRFRMSVPAAAVWTHATGVQVEAQPDGEGY